MDCEIEVNESLKDCRRYYITKRWHDLRRALHREGDKPAFISLYYDENNKLLSITLKWYCHGVETRDNDLPSTISILNDGYCVDMDAIYIGHKEYKWKRNGKYYCRDNYEPNRIYVTRYDITLDRYDEEGRYHSIDEYDRRVEYTLDGKSMIKSKREVLYNHGIDCSINDCPASILTRYFSDGTVREIEATWRNIDKQIHREENKPASVMYERNSILSPTFYIRRRWHRCGLFDRTDMGPCVLILYYDRFRTTTTKKHYFLSGSMVPSYEEYVSRYCKRQYPSVMKELRMKPGVGIEFYEVPMEELGCTEEELREWYVKNR